ncbi:MAG: efflux RND transporter permease subunit [Bacteroidota bacterium]|nr:efflux RND transporter permease subunit [Bacteroidota bacterium]
MIADIFIKRPITAMVISIVIVIVGILAILNLPVSQYPDITPPVVQVSSVYTGADATTVEQTVTTPIEIQVNGVPGMNYIQSNSTNDGRSSMSVYFEIGTNPAIATTEVQNRVNIATPILPDQVKRLGILVRRRNPSGLMNVAIFSPNGTHNIQFLDNFTNIFVRDALLRVKGVGDIYTRTDDFSMRIWLNPDKMASLGLSVAEVISAIQEQNVQVAAGSIGTPPQPPYQVFEYTATLNGRLSSVNDFSNIVVRSNPAKGLIVYLKDVARVELGKFNYAGVSFVDKRPASYMMIYQTPGSNALDVANGVYRALAQLSKSFPTDVAYSVPFESVSVVKVSITEVIKTLLEALGLVVLVIFIFLQDWRSTLIPILAIPVSIIGTFILFIPLGFTINKLTLFGFVLAIGIVVDDAIIVIEAVRRNMEENHLPPKEAAQKAMADISGAVVAIALVLAAVFVPAGFMPGIVGKLYQQFAITIAISVLISAFVALSLTPALCSLFLKPHHLSESSRGVNFLFFHFNKWFAKRTQGYTRNVRAAIKNARYVVTFLVLIVFCASFMLVRKPTGFIPIEDEGRLFVTFELPEASSVTRTVEVMKKIMDVLGETRGIGHFSAISGLNVVNGATKTNSGTLFVQLKPWDERKSRSQQMQAIMSQLQEKFVSIREATILVIPPPAIPGLGATGGFTFELQQRESNDDINTFEKNVNAFMAEANRRPEINRAITFFNARTPRYQLTVDRDRCKKMGVSLSEVFSTIQTYLGSSYINDFTIYNRNFRVIAQADTLFRNDIANLNKYYVRNSMGEMLPLSSVMTYKVTEGAAALPHYNLYRMAEFVGEARAGYSTGQALKALQETAQQILPQGYGFEFSGLSREEIKSGSSSTYVFILSLLFVFLFLSALYESWTVPITILLGVPLAAFGAILALTLVTKLSNNVYAQIGLITLIGLAASNSILIVEFAKERVDRGIDVVEATIEAVRLRLRPILMTSFAFIFGVSPLVFASGAGAVARQTIGWSVLGGMLAATSMGIFIIPVLFTLMIRLSYGKKKLAELQAQRNYNQEQKE